MVSHIERKVNPITEGQRILSNFAAFNSADAVATFHCIYDPETKEYYGEYKYYLTDYYDFGFAPTFQEHIMLGYAKSYELYGETAGLMNVSGNQSLYVQIPYLF